MKTSKGHVCFSLTTYYPELGYEYYEKDGQVYRASISNVFDADGHRFGRWECSRAHFDRFRHVICPNLTEAKGA